MLVDDRRHAIGFLAMAAPGRNNKRPIEFVAEFFTASILPGSTPRVAAVMIAHDLGNVAQLKAYARIEAALLGAKFCCEHTCIFGESGGDDMTTKCASFFALGLKKGAQAYDKKRLQSCGLDLRELLRDDAG